MTNNNDSTPNTNDKKESAMPTMSFSDCPICGRDMQVVGSPGEDSIGCWDCDEAIRNFDKEEDKWIPGDVIPGGVTLGDFQSMGTPDWEPFCMVCGDHGCIACDFGETENTLENPNVNHQKENTMTNTKITCEVKDCGKTAKFHMLVWALNTNAYAIDKLPATHVGGTWEKVEMDFCGTHKNVLHRGNAVTLALPYIPAVTYKLDVPEQRELFNTEVLHPEDSTNKEEDMNDMTEAHNYQEELMHMSLDELIEHAAGLMEAGSEITSMNAMGGYESEEEFQEELAPITEELTFVDKLIDNKQKEEDMKKKANKAILCGKCKGYHSTPKEVAQCYGVERKSTSPSGSKLVKEHKNSTSQWVDTKKEAIKLLGELGDISKGMRPAKNGNGVWVWWKNS
jgi:hypothetical protein